MLESLFEDNLPLLNFHVSKLIKLSEFCRIADASTKYKLKKSIILLKYYCYVINREIKIYLIERKQKHFIDSSKFIYFFRRRQIKICCF